MSSIHFVLLLKLALAINVSALATSGASADQVSADADVAALEAAVQAKYHLQESPPEAKPDAAHIGEARATSDSSNKADANREVPPDVAELEAAVHEKYHTFLEIMQGESEVLQDPILEPSKAEEVASEFSQEGRQESEAQSSSATGEAKGKIERGAEEAFDVVQLEAAVQAKYNSAGTKPRLNMNDKLEAGPDDVSKLAEAVQRKYNGFIDKMKSGSQARQTPALLPSKTNESATRRSLKAARQLNQSKSDAAEEAGAKPNPEVSEVEALEAAVQAKFQLKMPSARSQQEPIPQDIELNKSKAAIEVPSDVADLEAAVQAKYIAEVMSDKEWKPGSRLKLKVETNTEALSSSAKLEDETSKNPVMHDSLHSHKHGTAVAHVESASQRNASNASSKASVPETAIKERVDSLAAKRAEVEDVFHLSKADAYNSSSTPQTTQPEVPVSVGSSMVRFVVGLAAILIFIGLAYHKYEVILQIHGAKPGLPMVKVKQEDTYNVECGDFAPSSYGTQRSHENKGWSSTRDLILSAQSSGRGLVRRTTAQPMRVVDSAV